MQVPERPRHPGSPFKSANLQVEARAEGSVRDVIMYSTPYSVLRAPHSNHVMECLEKWVVGYPHSLGMCRFVKNPVPGSQSRLKLGRPDSRMRLMSKGYSGATGDNDQ